MNAVAVLVVATSQFLKDSEHVLNEHWHDLKNSQHTTLRGEAPKRVALCKEEL